MIALNCPNCNANIELDDARDFGFCTYCGTKVQIAPYVKISGIRTNVQRLNSAKKMISIGEFVEAKVVLDNIIEDEPDYGDAWVQLANIAEMQQHAKAIKLYNEALLYNKKFLKEDLISDFRKSNVIVKVVKLLGEEGVSICDALCKKLEVEIDGDVVKRNAEELETKKRKEEESRNIIGKIRINPMLLSEWTAWDNVSESGDGFFCYNGKVYTFDGRYRAYYVVTDITNNQINLELDRYGFGRRRYSDSKTETQEGPVAPKSKAIYIIFASSNELVTSLGRMHKHSKTQIDGKEYQRLIDSRVNQKVCPICGGVLSLFGKCRSGMH